MAVATDKRARDDIRHVLCKFVVRCQNSPDALAGGRDIDTAHEEAATEWVGLCAERYFYRVVTVGWDCGGDENLVVEQDFVGGAGGCYGMLE